MGFQIPGPTKGKVQYFVGVYQAVVRADHLVILTIFRITKQLFV
jgi:hypothetical protein